MGCTIGWIRTKDGYVLFKNRDINVNNPVFSNFIRKSENYISFEDRKYKQGLWFAINNYGIGIASTAGPYNEYPSGFMTEDFKKKLRKAIFLKATKDKITSADEVTKLYKKMFSKVFICLLTLYFLHKVLILTLLLEKVGCLPI